MPWINRRIAKISRAKRKSTLVVHAICGGKAGTRIVWLKTYSGGLWQTAKH
jgi:hypothetical protein